MPDLSNLTDTEREALDDLWHNCDLIHTRPSPCEIAWTLERCRKTMEAPSLGA